MKEEKIDPFQVIDIATELIPDTKPKTFIGKILRLIKKLNKIKNLVKFNPPR